MFVKKSGDKAHKSSTLKRLIICSFQWFSQLKWSIRHQAILQELQRNWHRRFWCSRLLVAKNALPPTNKVINPFPAATFRPRWYRRANLSKSGICAKKPVFFPLCPVQRMLYGLVRCIVGIEPSQNWFGVRGAEFQSDGVFHHFRHG